MSALYFSVLRPQDRVAVKPHASPVFHAIQYLFGHQTRDKLENFRGFKGAQSYPSRTKDPDVADFSTGSVGLGAVAPLFSAATRIGGLVTGADMSADGRVIAVRTYATIWLFDRPPGTTIAQALARTPCEAASRPEPQGEAIAILPGPGLRLATSGEGTRPDLNLISR